MKQTLRLIGPADFLTTKWSGGITRQLAIAPCGSIYGNRDFLWRVSSATVELAISDFTSLPDYNRYLSTIAGTIKLKHGDEAEFTMAPGQVDYFDGGVTTTSQGLCTDFNLMLRKGKCTGTMLSFTVAAGAELSLPVLAGEGKKTLVLFCTKGSGELKDSLVQQKVQEGEALLLKNPQVPVMKSEASSSFMLAEIISK